jgi:hypothetical protein
MANTSAPRGLIPVSYVSGAPYNGAHNVYFVPATDAQALFIGDPVIVVTNAADANGVPVVTRAAGVAGAAFDTPLITGVVTSIIPAGNPVVGFTRDSPVYRPASVAAYIGVADDPNLLFEVQENSVGGGGTGGSFVVGASGRNTSLIAGAGSVVTGYSGYQLDSSVLVTTQLAPIRILRNMQRTGKEIGPKSKWLVKIVALHHTQMSSTGI